MNERSFMLSSAVAGVKPGVLPAVAHVARVPALTWGDPYPSSRWETAGGKLRPYAPAIGWSWWNRASRSSRTGSCSRRTSDVQARSPSVRPLPVMARVIALTP